MKKLEEVFKLSGIPTYTFVQPVEYNKLCCPFPNSYHNIIEIFPK